MLDDTSSSCSFELINEEPDPIDNDFDWEFSIIEEATDDDYSFLDFCGDLLGNIELIPTVRSYKHSRNVQLNRRLDFAVLFSVAIVTGLGLGNFLGHSSQCARMRSAMEDLHKEMNIPQNIPSCVSSIAAKTELMKVDDVGNREGIPLLTVEGKYLSTFNSLETDIANSLIVVPNAENYSIPLAAPSITESIAGAEFALSDELTDVSSSSPKAAYTINRNNDDVKTSSHSENKESPKPFTYHDMLNLLKDDIGDIVRKMQNLITVMINEEKISSEKFSAMEDMFQQFLLSISEKTKELKELVDASSFDVTTNGKKYFSKMSQIIVKSVDLLMKDSVVNILGNKKKTTDNRLNNVTDTGYNILKELDQRWNSQKQKLHYHKSYKSEQRKITKFQENKNFKHKKYDTKFNKRKVENEKSFDNKGKRNLDKKQFKIKNH